MEWNGMEWRRKNGEIKKMYSIYLVINCLGDLRIKLIKMIEASILLLLIYSYFHSSQPASLPSPTFSKIQFETKTGSRISALSWHFPSRLSLVSALLIKSKRLCVASEPFQLTPLSPFPLSSIKISFFPTAGARLKEITEKETDSNFCRFPTPEGSMEIDKAIRESDDRRLKTKYNNAIYVIKRALALYSIEEVAFSFNGGKDSTVLLHLLRAAYFLHKGEQSCLNGVVEAFPIRTIYFESPSAFPEINSFTYDTANIYNLQLDIIRLDFKSGLEDLIMQNPIRAIFLGVRIGDPTAVGQEQFSPSSSGWPPFMRVNPILDWSYRDVWSFLLTCKVPYCSLYDKGYTSIGSIYDTVPNSLLCTINSSGSKGEFKPAYFLSDGRLERAGRVKKIPASVDGHSPSIDSNLEHIESHRNGMVTVSVIGVGDEILFGTVEDHLGPSLCKKFHQIGWSVVQAAIVRNDIDSVAEEVERQKAANDMVFLYGGVGLLHSDITVSGVAKAFGARMVPDEEFEECLRKLIGDHCTGDRNEMAQLPEGVTELLCHEKLAVPLIKCENVFVLSATNVPELDNEWDCLIEIGKSLGFLPLMQAYSSKQVETTLSDVEAAEPLSRLCLEFPDLHIGCYRKSRKGPLVISLEGKEPSRIKSAQEVLQNKIPTGAFSDIS